MGTTFERLSGQDASFLTYEDADPNAHMHIGGISVFTGGAVTRRRGLDIERIRRYVASRLHLIPRYRQRLAFTPLTGEPVWVDDHRFNVRYHVRHTRLPRPGDERELKRLAAQIMSQRLDRRRPLWELWFIEGLADDRFAMVTKTHHCMVDGVSGVDLTTVTMRMTPDDAIEAAPDWTPQPEPGALELAADDLGRRVRVPRELARAFGSAVGGLRGDGARATWAAAARMAGMALRGGAATCFNQPIGPHRRFDWTTFPLDEVKRIKNRLGGTVNDVVLAVVAGAVGEFLRYRRINVDLLDFLAEVPVNARAQGDRSMGNQVAAWLVRLPIAERDPLARLARVSEVTAELKQSTTADLTSYFYQAAEWGGPPILSLVVGLMRTANPGNLIVTNVPGPPFRLYLLGAEMAAAYPLVTLLAGQGLGIAVFSYCGTLHFGFNADWDLLPDLHRFVQGVERELAAFRALADRAGAETAAAPPARTRRTGARA